MKKKSARYSAELIERAVRMVAEINCHRWYPKFAVNLSINA
jgi:hypothetical protein